MKIAMVSGHFELPIDSIPIGGVQRHISRVTDELRQRGHSIDWFYPGQRTYLENANPDIVVAHDFFCFMEELNCPQICIFHGWEGRCPPDAAVVTRRCMVEKMADASIHVGDYIGKWYSQKADRVIYGGVKPVEFVSPPGKNNFLYLGRLEPDNSPDMFFCALSMLSIPYTLQVCGNGSLREYLEGICKTYNINATFHGFVEDPDSYIKSSDIVFTSGYLSILEAFINKRPVISAFSNELKKDYLQLMPAQTFSYEYPVDIREKFIDILENGTEESVEKNYEFACSNTWDKVADVYEEMIERCLSSRT